MLSKCLYPVTIKVHGRLQKVPCGHCEPCLSLKAFKWKKRLDIECTFWQHTLFFTLTYDDVNLPVLVLNPSSNSCEYEQNKFFYFDRQLVDKLSNHYVLQSDGSFHIPYMSRSDLKLFIQKLKSYAPKIRYFIQSELGPSTLRPHYHGLLFFSDYSSEEVVNYICASWPKCDWFIHRQFIKEVRATSYVTSYVASFSNYPSIFKTEEFRPFHYSSNRPPLGVQHAQSFLAPFQHGEVVTYPQPDGVKHVYSEVEFPRSYEDKFYPKLPFTFGLDVRQVLFLLFSYRYFSKQQLNQTIVDELLQSYKRKRFSPFFHYKCVWNRLCEVSPSFLSLSNSLLVSSSSLYRIYRASKDFCTSRPYLSLQAAFFEYDTYLYKKAMYQLKQQYDFEIDFVSKFSPKYLIFKDLNFVERYANNFTYSPTLDLIVRGYGYDGIDDFTSTYYRYSLERNPVQKRYFSKISEFVHNSHKSHANNSYLAAHGLPSYANSGL